MSSVVDGVAGSRVSQAPRQGYVLDNAGADTPDRFAALGALHDGATARHLDRIGVGEGWRCLDVGAGDGGVARLMADRVGPTGRVTATDLDTRWLGQPRDPRLDVLQHDITREALPGGYDLVHTRLVLGHVPRPLDVLRTLVSALVPGGWLLVEEYDVTFVRGACHLGAGCHEYASNRVREAFLLLLEEGGATVDVAHRFLPVLRAEGLVGVAAEGGFTVGHPAAAALERANIRQTRRELERRGLVTADEIDAHLDRLDRVPLSMPAMVSTWGRRPPVRV